MPKGNHFFERNLAVTGLAPMFYGITIDTLVTLTALAVIWGMGLMGSHPGKEKSTFNY